MSSTDKNRLAGVCATSDAAKQRERARTGADELHIRSLHADRFLRKTRAPWQRGWKVAKDSTKPLLELRMKVNFFATRSLWLPAECDGSRRCRAPGSKRGRDRG